MMRTKGFDQEVEAVKQSLTSADERFLVLKSSLSNGLRATQPMGEDASGKADHALAEAGLLTPASLGARNLRTEAKTPIPGHQSYHHPTDDHRRVPSPHQVCTPAPRTSVAASSKSLVALSLKLRTHLKRRVVDTAINLLTS